MPRPPQTGFTQALRDPSIASLFPPERFAIYRSNRIAALTESLAATYSATERLVGAPFFHALACAFIGAHPPHTPVLHEYGAAFPSFIERYEAAADLAYLGDVARIEWAWMEAYHAADCEALSADCLFDYPDEAVEELIFCFHPSFSLIRSAYPAATIWQINTDGGTPGPIDAWHRQNVVVVRPNRDVVVHTVCEGTAFFLAALGAGLPLGLAAGAARGASPNFDLPAQLAAAFARGLITAVSWPAPKELRT